MTRHTPPLARRSRLAHRLAELIAGQGHFISLPHPPTASNEPRYGYGEPSHRRLTAALSRYDDRYEETLRTIGSYAADLRAIPASPTDPLEPHWQNGYLFGLDAPSLYAFIRSRQPQRYFEIGSGNSTLFAGRARRDGALQMEIMSIDPFPRREVDEICDRIMRQPLEESDLSIFSELEAGDVVFMDGTHRVFMNSDATTFFLDVLPDLPAGVLVGIHDIHLPDDYRPEHANSYYSEQYLLAAYLLAECDWITPVLPCWYVSHHPSLGDLAASMFAADRIPLADPHGVIFWLEKH